MKGVFVGLTTLDSVYLVDRLPGADEKCVARDFAMNAGGPATNAAVTFAYLGGRACLVSAIGASPAAALVHADLARYGVRHVELMPEQSGAGGPSVGAPGTGKSPGSGVGPAGIGPAGPRGGAHAPGVAYGTPAAGVAGPAGGPGGARPGGAGGPGRPGGAGGPGGNQWAQSGHAGVPGASPPGHLGHPGQAGAPGAHRVGVAAPAGPIQAGGGALAKPVATGHLSGLAPASYALPMSAVMVTALTGERAVTSAHGMVPRCAANTAAATAVADADVLMLDGHQVDAAIGLLRSLRGGGPPVLLDGGSWKPGTEQVLPFVDVVICSAAFRPPGFDTRVDILDVLLGYGPFFVAATDGPGPIRWATAEQRGYVLPPVVTARDTLGAGDVLHGAFAWMLAHGAIATDELVGALGEASRVAARSVQSFGPRSWMT